MATATQPHLLVRGSEAKRYEKLGIEVSSELSERAAEEILNLFVLVSPLQLCDVAGVVKAANRKKHLRGLFVEQGRDPHWVTAMLDRADLRTLKNTLVHSDPQVFERVLNAWSMEAQDQLVADATVQEEVLFIRTCALETIEIEMRQLKPFKKAKSEEMLHFEVASDGAYVYWPRLDVHLDVETVRIAKDPDLQEKYRRERIENDRRLGQAIRELRKKAGLRQKDIDGVSARQVRRIENGEARARTKTLRCFAEAHEMGLNDYLNEIAESMGGQERRQG